jgi:hypothetical protein
VLLITTNEILLQRNADLAQAPVAINTGCTQALAGAL